MESPQKEPTTPQIKNIKSIMYDLKTAKNLLDIEWKHQTSSNTAAVTDFWEALMDAQKRRVEQAIQQMERGQGMPHEKVMVNIRKKWKRC